MKISVKNLKNEEVRELDLPERVFAYPYKEHLIYLAVQAFRAAARSGTHKTKVRSEVSGGGTKPWRQKGTGRARAGSIRSPLWRSGGTVHGPKPRNYEKKMTPREKRNALKSALSRKFSENRILVVENLDLESHRTSDFGKILSGLGVDSKILIVDRHDNRNLMLASRNNPGLKTVDALAVNVYDVVDRHHLVLSEAAMGRLVEVLNQ